MDFDDRLQLFGMHNLLLEGDLFNLENDGIELGRHEELRSNSVVDTEVFEAQIRRQANEMRELYYLYFCLENSIRKTISERLSEKSGANWWEKNVPSTVIKKAERVKKQEMDTPFSERSEEPIYYTDFRDLASIIEDNWDTFSDTFRSVESMTQTLTALNVLRRPIAHSSTLNEDEILRFKLLIKDWIRIQM